MKDQDNDQVEMEFDDSPDLKKERVLNALKQCFNNPQSVIYNNPDMKPEMKITSQQEFSLAFKKHKDLNSYKLKNEAIKVIYKYLKANFGVQKYKPERFEQVKNDDTEKAEKFNNYLLSEKTRQTLGGNPDKIEIQFLPDKLNYAENINRILKVFNLPLEKINIINTANLKINIINTENLNQVLINTFNDVNIKREGKSKYSPEKNLKQCSDSFYTKLNENYNLPTLSEDDGKKLFDSLKAVANKDGKVDIHGIRDKSLWQFICAMFGSGVGTAKDNYKKVVGKFTKKILSEGKSRSSGIVK